MPKKAHFIVVTVNATCPHCGGALVDWRGSYLIEVADVARKFECEECHVASELKRTGGSLPRRGS